MIYTIAEKRIILKQNQLKSINGDHTESEESKSTDIDYNSIVDRLQSIVENFTQIDDNLKAFSDSINSLRLMLTNLCNMVKYELIFFRNLIYTHHNL